MENLHLTIKLANNEIMDFMGTEEEVLSVVEKITKKDAGWIQIQNTAINTSQIVKIDFECEFDRTLREAGVQKVKLNGTLYACSIEGCEYLASKENGYCASHKINT